MQKSNLQPAIGRSPGSLLYGRWFGQLALLGETLDHSWGTSLPDLARASKMAFMTVTLTVPLQSSTLPSPLACRQRVTP